VVHRGRLDRRHRQGGRALAHLSMTEGVANGDRAETEWGAHLTDAEYREEQ